MKNAKGCLFWLAFVVAASLTWNWFDSLGGRWTASVYPAPLPVAPIRVDGFDTFEACRIAAEAELTRRSARTTGSFECGRKCEIRRNGVQYCAETRP